MSSTIDPSTLPSHFGTLEADENGLYRFAKRTGDFVVTTFVTNRALSKRELDDWIKIQEGPVADFYYSHPGRARWNIYLYLILQSGQAVARRTRAEIERDTSYARKRVVEHERVAELAGRTLASVNEFESSVEESVLSQWRSLLHQGNLSALEGAASYADIIRFLASEAAMRSPPEVPHRSSDIDFKATSPAAGVSQISQVEITRFRRLPPFRTSPGRFHLIHGPNASGKTSFLSAVERALCGPISASEAREDPFQASVTLGNGDQFETPRTPREQKALESQWYHQFSAHSSSLRSLFRVHNFYASDAASDFARGGSAEFAEALKRLVAGPDLTRLWTRIQGAHERIPRERQVRRDALSRCSLEKQATEERIQHLIQAANRDNLAIEKLRRTYAELSGREAILSIDEMYALLPSQPSPLEDRDLWKGPWRAARQAPLLSTRLSLSRLPTTLAALDRARELATLEQNLATSRRQVEMVDAGLRHEWPKLWASMEASAMLLKQHAPGLPQIEASLSRVRSTPGWFPHEEISDSTIASERDALHALQNEIAEAKAGQSQLNAALALLRSHANRGQMQADCPLCGASYPEREALVAAIDNTISRDETRVAEMLAERSRRESRLAGIGELLRLAQLLDLPPRQSAEMIVIAADRIVATQHELKSEQARALAKLKTTSAPNKAEYAGAEQSLLAVMGGRPPVTTEHVAHAMRILDDRLRQVRGEHAEVRARLSDFVGPELESDATRLLAQSVRTSDIEFLTRFRDDATIETIVDWMASVRVYSTRRPGMDATAESELLTLKAQLKELTSKEAILRAEHASFARAEKALSELIRNNSLDDHVSSQFQRHQTSISHIFRMMHTPYEFDSISFEAGKLSLKGTDGAERDVSQISSGQRAALALSTFLAVNLRARSAPPVILLDDPIALVDDMNTIGFVDILRELVVNGDRQIFFATANSTIAGLIEAKIPPTYLTTLLLDHRVDVVERENS